MFSRPVLIARNLLSKPVSCFEDLSQVTYCGGYSGVEPPLSIPNREVKRTSADGTAPPGGRVGRCRFSEARSRQLDRASFFVSPPRAPLRRPSASEVTGLGPLRRSSCRERAFRAFWYLIAVQRIVNLLEGKFP